MDNDYQELSCYSFNTDDYYNLVPTQTSLSNIVDTIYADNLRLSKSRLSELNAYTNINGSDSKDLFIRNCKTANDLTNKKVVKFEHQQQEQPQQRSLNIPKSAPTLVSKSQTNHTKGNIDVRLLAIIMKHKLNGFNEDKLEELIKENKIFTQNRLTPFKRPQREYDLNMNDESRMGTSMSSIKIDIVQPPLPPQEPFDAKCLFSEEYKQELNTIECNLDKLSKYKVSDYYFRNMNDLKYKYCYSNSSSSSNKRQQPHVLLSKTPVPHSSNKLFQCIEKFDIAEKYKQQKLSRKQDNSNVTIRAYKNKKRNSLEESLKPKQERDLFEKYKFISSRKFKLVEPVFQQYYDPPLLNLKFQKINQFLDKASIANASNNGKRLMIRNRLMAH